MRIDEMRDVEAGGGKRPRRRAIAAREARKHILVRIDVDADLVLGGAFDDSGHVFQILFIVLARALVLDGLPGGEQAHDVEAIRTQPCEVQVRLFDRKRSTDKAHGRRMLKEALLGVRRPALGRASGLLADAGKVDAAQGQLSSLLVHELRAVCRRPQCPMFCRARLRCIRLAKLSDHVCCLANLFDHADELFDGSLRRLEFRLHARRIQRHFDPASHSGAGEVGLNGHRDPLQTELLLSSLFFLMGSAECRVDFQRQHGRSAAVPMGRWRLVRSPRDLPGRHEAKHRRRQQ